MSKQVRTQMPQTQKKDKWSKSKGKKFDKNACLLVFVLIFSGILIFFLLTASDNKKLNRGEWNCLPLFKGRKLVWTRGED